MCSGSTFIAFQCFASSHHPPDPLELLVARAETRGTSQSPQTWCSFGILMDFGGFRLLSGQVETNEWIDSTPQFESWSAVFFLKLSHFSDQNHVCSTVLMDEDSTNHNATNHYGYKRHSSICGTICKSRHQNFPGLPVQWHTLWHATFSHLQRGR